MVSKSTFMKKLFSLILFVAFAATASYAQTVSFLLTSPPCHNDGVLTATFTGLTPPLTVTWQTAGTSGTSIIHTGVSGLNDALTGYSGGEITLYATDASGLSDTGFYAGQPPFTICPLTVSPGALSGIRYHNSQHLRRWYASIQLPVV